MAKFRPKKGNYRDTALLSADIMLSIVCIGTYFIDCELNFISLFFMETLNIPHIHLGIYNSKLTCFRSIFIILGCLTEYGIYKICNKFKLEEKHPKYREGLSIFFLFALCVVRIILTLILYFSKQLRLHLYIILNVEAFYFGIFQTSFISLAMDHSGDIKLLNYILSGTMKFFQFRISRSETNKPMLYLKINFFICVGISIISLIIWPVYLFRLHKPLYQYDQYIFFVKTRIHTIISHSEECIGILNDAKKKIEEINTTECDEKNKNVGGTGSTTEEKDSNDGKDSSTIENGDTENSDEITSANREDSQKVTYSNESDYTESDVDDEISYANGEHSEESEHRESDEEEEENEEENNSTNREQYSDTDNYSNKDENGESIETDDSEETTSTNREHSEKENDSNESEGTETENDNGEDSGNETNISEDEEESEEDDVFEEITSTGGQKDSNNGKDSSTIENGDTENSDEEGEHSETTDDDVIITTTRKPDPNIVDNSNKSENNEMCVNNKLINEVFVLLDEMDDSKLYYAATNIMNENSHMEFDRRKHKEFYELLIKETNSLLDLGGKIKSFQSTIKRLRKKFPWESHEIKDNLDYLVKGTNDTLDNIKKLNQASKNFNEQIKKIVHKNLKWALSTMLMIIPTTIIFYFLFDGVLPHAIIIDEESKHIIVMTSVSLFVGSMPPVTLTSKKDEYRYWTWENSCFWLALIPQIAILVSAILAIHSKISYFKFIIDVPIIVTLMCTILGICHGLMESTSFISVTNHVYFHSADPDDFYLVIIQIILRIYLKYISLKLSACYNEARISLGFFRPDFYTFLEVGSLEAFMITVKQTLRRFFFDLFFDIRVNINQFI